MQSEKSHVFGIETPEECLCWLVETNYAACFKQMHRQMCVSNGVSSHFNRSQPIKLDGNMNSHTSMREKTSIKVDFYCVWNERKQNFSLVINYLLKHSFLPISDCVRNTRIRFQTIQFMYSSFFSAARLSLAQAMLTFIVICQAPSNMNNHYKE